MTVSQISVFSESKPGHLCRVLNSLEKESINVRGYSISDTGDYGIVRIIVDRPEDAMDALVAAGFACVVTPVICIRLVDYPGELARVMNVLAQAGENISYSYSMLSTYIVIVPENLEVAMAALKDAGIETVTQADVTRIVAENTATKEA